MFCKNLAYCKDPSELFTHFANTPWNVLLDAFPNAANHESLAIIGINPIIKITAYATQTKIELEDGSEILSEDDPFTILRTYLAKFPKNKSTLKFIGGAIGYFSYDLIRRFENLSSIAKSDCNLPLMQVGIYNQFILIDHANKTTKIYAASASQINMIAEQITIQSKPLDPFKLISPFNSNLTKERYENAFNKVTQHLKEGHCYQINLTQRFEAEYVGSSWQAYQTLRKINPAPYAAFLNYPETSILSFSPEQFIECHDKSVTTKPIKGTIKRSDDPNIDKQNKHLLFNSEKDKAENLMIVDLLRNDLGRVCQYGSIKVPELFALKTFANVHHLVSTVKGKLTENHDVLDLLKACFPGGSVTGTPKISAMEIIENIEPNRRTIYCGSIGFIDSHHTMNLNIAIRTLYTYKNKMYCAAGGAIVIDSKVESEYQESLDKVSNLLRALEAM